MSVLELTGVSRWFGDVVAVNDVTMTLGPGVTGLLGPNGAGKSTIIHLLSGFLAPSAGTVTLDGEPVRGRPEVYRRIGLVPEREAMYDASTGWQLVLANARLHRVDDPAAAARSALEAVEMTEAAGRRVSTYSKGMKQRVKMATALVHDPDVLLLDEPFNGMDPRQRLQMTRVLDAMGRAGRTVLFSSHVLEEVEALATSVEVVVAGRHAASGDFRAIRALMTSRPHRYTVRSDDDRALAAALIAHPCTTSVEVGTGAGGDTDALRVQASDLGAFARALPVIARERGVRLHEVRPDDASLESVFGYLVDQGGR